MRKTITSTAALTAAALTLGLAGPANAVTSIGVTDPVDTWHGSDLRAVHVEHRDHRVVVVTQHSNLRRDWRTGSSGSVFLDTDPDDWGPEYVFAGGYFEGTDYVLLETEGFSTKTWGEPVEGNYEMTIRYGRDRVRMRMARAIFDGPSEVRVAVKVSGTRTDGTRHGLVDWLGDKREFTTWVSKG